MAASCVKACNLCYPTLSAAELRRRQDPNTPSSKEGRTTGTLGPEVQTVVHLSPQLNPLVTDVGVLFEDTSACRLGYQRLIALRTLPLMLSKTQG